MCVCVAVKWLFLVCDLQRCLARARRHRAPFEKGSAILGYRNAAGDGTSAVQCRSAARIAFVRTSRCEPQQNATARTQADSVRRSSDSYQFAGKQLPGNTAATHIKSAFARFHPVSCRGRHQHTCNLVRRCRRVVVRRRVAVRPAPSPSSRLSSPRSPNDD